MGRHPLISTRLGQDPGTVCDRCHSISPWGLIHSIRRGQLWFNHIGFNCVPHIYLLPMKHGMFANKNLNPNGNSLLSMGQFWGLTITKRNYSRVIPCPRHGRSKFPRIFSLATHRCTSSMAWLGDGMAWRKAKPEGRASLFAVKFGHEISRNIMINPWNEGCPAQMEIWLPYFKKL